MNCVINRIFNEYRKMFAPKIIVNSIPKAGTNLLLKIFYNIRWLKVINKGVDFLMTPTEIESSLSRLRNGEYMYAHLPYNPKYNQLIKQLSLRHLLIVRDPRDIVVSHAFYVAYGQASHRLHQFYKSLKSDRDRIMATIRGVPDHLIKGGQGLDSIAERFKNYSPWLQDPLCLVVKFEDLIGKRGMGDDRAQLILVRKIIKHVGLNITEKELLLIVDSIYDTSSPTFRVGQVGNWKAWLNSDMLEILAQNKHAFQAFGYKL